MKNLTLVFSVFLMTTVISFGQARDQASSTAKLKIDANKMGESFLKGDFKTFSNYTYPKILQAVGGAAKMEQVLTKTVADLKSQGISFTRISFDEPTRIITSGNELQSTITQHTEMNTSNGKTMTNSILIAISTDNGNNWTFVDTSNKDMKTLRQVLPNLSKDIVLPGH